MRLAIQGDSVSTPYPVTVAQSWYQAVINYLTPLVNTPISVLNYAVSGRMASDQTWNIKNNEVGDINFLEFGINDTNWSGSNTAAKKTVYECSMRTLMLNYSGFQIVKGVNMIRSAGFTPFTGAYDTWGIVSSTAGDYAQETVYGTAVYVSYIFKTDETGAQFDVLIDGVVKETVTTLGTAVGDTPSGINLIIFTKRYAELAEGPHLVKIVNKVTGKNVYVQGIWGNSRQFFKKPLFALNIIKKVNYLTAGDSDANVSAYNTILLNTLNELKSDGCPLWYVDIYPKVSTATDYYDNVHPIASGHAKMGAETNLDIAAAIALNVGVPATGSGPCTPVPCAPLNGHVTMSGKTLDLLYDAGVLKGVTIT